MYIDNPIEIKITEYEDTSYRIVVAPVIYEDEEIYKFKLICPAVKSEFVIFVTDYDAGVSLLESYKDECFDKAKKLEEPKSSYEININNAIYDFSERGYKALRNFIKNFIFGIIYIVLLCITSDYHWRNIFFFTAELSFGIAAINIIISKLIDWLDNKLYKSAHIFSIQTDENLDIVIEEV